MNRSVNTVLWLVGSERRSDLFTMAKLEWDDKLIFISLISVVMFLVYGLGCAILRVRAPTKWKSGSKIKEQKSKPRVPLYEFVWNSKLYIKSVLTLKLQSNMANCISFFSFLGYIVDCPVQNWRPLSTWSASGTTSRLPSKGTVSEKMSWEQLVIFLSILANTSHIIHI